MKISMSLIHYVYIIHRLIFGFVGDLWFANGVVLSGIGAALSGLFCMMSDTMTSFAEQCIFVIILSIAQGKNVPFFIISLSTSKQENESFSILKMFI